MQPNQGLKFRDVNLRKLTIGTNCYNNMPKPRYDENENKSRHAAADEDCCDEMAEKYGWQLVDVERTGHPILEVDCVFNGKTEFPTSYYDTEKEED